MIADVNNNKKLNRIVTEIFIRGRKVNIFLGRNHVLKYEKELRSILDTFLLSKFPIKENFNKLQ